MKKTKATKDSALAKNDALFMVWCFVIS